MEYSLSLAVKGGEISSADGGLILGFWNEADVIDFLHHCFSDSLHFFFFLCQAQMQGKSFEEKSARLQKSIGTRFGPKAKSINEIVRFLSSSFVRLE